MSDEFLVEVMSASRYLDVIGNKQEFVEAMFGEPIDSDDIASEPDEDWFPDWKPFPVFVSPAYPFVRASRNYPAPEMPLYRKVTVESNLLWDKLGRNKTLTRQALTAVVKAAYSVRFPFDSVCSGPAPYMFLVELRETDTNPLYADEWLKHGTKRRARIPGMPATCRALVRRSIQERHYYNVEDKIGYMAAVDLDFPGATSFGSLEALCEWLVSGLAFSPFPWSVSPISIAFPHDGVGDSSVTER